ncbi:MAG: hypothetical protein MUP69_10425 [Candidatus Atribacteria bacterium]|nr:hypothetical protein [Candidatus Atribacteria bacterium]
MTIHIYDDFKKEIIEVLPFNKRVSPETLLKLKENSQSNQGRVKYYELVEGVFSNPYIKEKVLEGV